MIITKDDFVSWKNNPVTQAVFHNLAIRAQDLQIGLGSNAGKDPLEDRRIVGYITAIADFLATSPEDLSND